MKTSRWLSQQGIDYMLVLAPSKQYVYPKMLPHHIRRLPRANVVEQLTVALTAYPEVEVLNLRPILKHSASTQQLCYKADSHWNYNGANIAQYALGRRLQLMLPNRLEPYLYPAEAFTETRPYYGDLAQYMGCQSILLKLRASRYFHNAVLRYRRII